MRALKSENFLPDIVRLLLSTEKGFFTSLEADLTCKLRKAETNAFERIKLKAFIRTHHFFFRLDWLKRCFIIIIRWNFLVDFLTYPITRLLKYTNSKIVKSKMNVRLLLLQSWWSDIIKLKHFKLNIIVKKQQRSFRLITINLSEAI